MKIHTLFLCVKSGEQFMGSFSSRAAAKAWASKWQPGTQSDWIISVRDLDDPSRRGRDHLFSIK